MQKMWNNVYHFEQARAVTLTPIWRYFVLQWCQYVPNTTQNLIFLDDFLLLDSVTYSAYLVVTLPICGKVAVRQTFIAVCSVNGISAK